MVTTMTEPHDIRRLFEDGAAIDAALAAAARSAVCEALLRGRPVVVWQDGQVVELPADQIPALDSALNLETRSITT
jgi:hypothetical protein